MIYKTIGETIERLISEKPNPQDMLQFITSGSKNNYTNSGIISLTGCLLSIGNIVLTDVERITIIKDNHIHAFICEVTDSFSSKYDEELGGGSFISPSTIMYDGEYYTVIIVSNLYNLKESKSNSLCETIFNMYELLINEFESHIIGLYNNRIPNEQNFAAINSDYARLYIPIGICHYNDVHIDEKYERLECVKSFIKLISRSESKQDWYNLFDNNIITTYYDSDEYPELCYKLEYSDEDYQDDIN